MELMRTTRCEINIDNLGHNISVLNSHLTGNTIAMAVIKADGYGHGAVRMMRYMGEFGISHFAVATLNEALELRRAHDFGEVTVFGLTPDHMLHHAAQNNIIQTICSIEQAEVLNSCGHRAKVFIKFDSGMHRIGYRHTEQTVSEVCKIASMDNIEIMGIYTHLALKDRQSDFEQFDAFKAFIADCEAGGAHFPIKSISDGIAIIRYPEMAMDMVRPGSFLFGFNPHIGEDLKLVMNLKSEIAMVQHVEAGQGIGYDLLDVCDYDRKIATLPFGYIDGCPRAMSHRKGWVSVRGERAEIVGLMCMDMCMIDVTDIKDVKAGDEVIVFGDKKSGAMTYPEGAAISNFNRNGLQSAPSHRVPRVYFKNGQMVEIVDGTTFV